MSGVTFFLLCLEAALLSFNVAACSALVPSIAQELGRSPFVVGRIVWIYMLPYGLAAFLYGPLVRAFDAKRVELVCVLGFSLANLAAAFSRSLEALFAARFFLGVFGASVTPLALILITRHTAESRRGKAVGVFFAASFFSSLAGLLLSGIVHWRLIFLVPAVFGALLWVALFIFLPSYQADATGFACNYVRALGNRRVASIFLFIFLVSLIYHGVQPWLGVYFSRVFGLGQLAVSLLLTLTSLAGIFGETLGGWAADSWGRLKTTRAGLLLMIVSVLLLIFRLPLAGLAVLMVVWGLGWTVNHAGVSTLLTDLPVEFINEAASLNSGVRFLSGGLGAAAAGVVMQYDFRAGFILFAAGFVILLWFSRSLLMDGSGGSARRERS